MIRLFEMFSGYAGASHALKKAGIPFQCVGYSEIDKYAIQCYDQNFPGVTNFGDCTKIDVNTLPDFDLLTGGFPCQSFSVAGKGLGEQDTRGTLFYEIIRIAEAKKPRWMLLENVKGLIFKKHKATFDKILSELDRIGYDVHWKVLNSKEHGIPQNRERVFFVCFDRAGLLAEKRQMVWPEKEELKIFLKDILEDKVDDKYYLNQEQVDRLMSKERSYNERMCKPECSPTLCSRDYKDPKTVAIPCLTPNRIEKRQDGRRFKDDGEPMFTINTQDVHGIVQINNPTHSNDRVYDSNGVSPIITQCNPDKIVQINNPTYSNDRVYDPVGISPTINTMEGGNRQPFILDLYNNKIKENVCPTLTEPHHNNLRLMESNLTIRKLTPTECFRLQGFLNDEIKLDGISNSQRYKMAGNGWELSVVSKIFKSMFTGHRTTNRNI